MNAQDFWPALRGRLAPSPTGRIHLGNAFAFLVAWACARKDGGTVVMRVEDIDPVRSRPHFIQGVIDDLHWLGLDWDEGPGCKGEADVANPACPGPFAPYMQSGASHCYHAALQHLQGLTYPCFCTRKELKTMASAPHLEDGSPVYDGRCRGLSLAEREKRITHGQRYTLRLDVDAALHSMPHLTQPPEDLSPSMPRDTETAQNLLLAGDFALMRSDGVPAYQLAVVVDDGRMGITQVVRGNDLCASTPRQILLLRLLGYTPPDYLHIPLLCDHEGERLAKRHNSLEIAALRAKGILPEQVVGVLAWLMGFVPEATPLATSQFVSLCDPPGLLKKQRILLPCPEAALFSAREPELPVQLPGV